MPRHRKESLGTDAPFVMRLSEAMLVHVTHGLHDEAEGEQHDAGNVPAGAEAVLRIPRDGRGVEDGDGQGDRKDPDHLEDPEAEEGKELVTLVVEAVIPTRLDDAEEEETGETEGPDDEEEGGDELAGVVVAAQ